MPERDDPLPRSSVYLVGLLPVIFLTIILAVGMPPSTAVVAALQHRLDFLHKLTNVFELAVNGGEADIGHFVEPFEILHRQVAEYRRRHLPVVAGEHLILNPPGELFDLLGSDRPLVACPLQTA